MEPSGDEYVGRRIAKQINGQGAFLFKGRVASVRDDNEAKVYHVVYDKGQDGCRTAKEESLSFEDLCHHFESDDDDDEEEESAEQPKAKKQKTVSCTWKNEFVSPVFFQHHPEQLTEWKPVDHAHGTRLSPQSGKACQALNTFYTGLDNAWDAGWRWLLLPNNHMWYAPATATFDDDASYAAVIKEKSRGGKNKGSMKSPDVAHVLAVIAKIQ